MPLGRPMRVLCLHGFRTSASIMKFQCRDMPADLLKLDFLNGFPATGEPEDIVKQFFEPPYYEWFNKVGEEYKGVRESLAYIRDHARKHGPYDGVLGFSQGGALASLLVVLDKWHYPRISAGAGAGAGGQPSDAGSSNSSSSIWDEPPPLPDLKFAIISSGFVPRDADVKRLYPSGEDGQLIDLPVFCVHGATDFVKTHPVAALFNGSVIAEHLGGHEPPNRRNGQAALTQLRAFLERVQVTSEARAASVSVPGALAGNVQGEDDNDDEEDVAAASAAPARG